MSFNIKKTYEYHILYVTTNKINGKKYIGVHSTNNINDGYIGSGVLLKKAINKYGIENFEKHAISFFNSREELLKAENNFITKNIIEDDTFYNLSMGGLSFIDSLINLDDLKKFKQHQSNAGKLGGKAAYNKKSKEQKTEWHRKGGMNSTNSGGYKMSVNGKNNISDARKNSIKYFCPLCNSKPLDGGNFNKHLILLHNVNKEDCYQWRAGAKVAD